MPLPLETNLEVERSSDSFDEDDRKFGDAPSKPGPLCALVQYERLLLGQSCH